MALVTIIRAGNLIAVGCGDGPPPADLAARLAAEMRYTHRWVPEPGQDRDENGRKIGVQTRTELLHLFDQHGRLVCGPGYLYRIREAADELGHRIEMRDARTSAFQTPRPDRYDVDWELMFSVMAREGYDLRPRQDECLAAMELYDRGLIDAPPGFGKSAAFTFYALAHPKAKIHILVDRASVMDRIYREMSTFLPNVGRVGDGHRRFERVTIVSAYSAQWTPFDDITDPACPDVVLADEVHRLVGPAAWANVVRYRWARMYGFSATLSGRFDGAEAVLESVFGRTIFLMTYPEAVSLGLVVPIEVEWLTVAGDDPTKDLVKSDAILRNGIWRNPVRNQAIMDRVAALPADDQTLILTATIDHLVHLKRYRPDLTLVYDKLDADRYQAYCRAKLLDPERDPIMTNELRERLTRRFEAGELKLVAANQVWDTGVSFNGLQNLVIAHGKKTKIGAVQGPGRVSRISAATGKQIGRVIDCYDTWSEKFAGYSKERSAVYAQQGWSQFGIPVPKRRTRVNRD